MRLLFVKHIPCKTYLSLVDPNGKSRFACFSEREVGNNCVKYISNFKFKHGVWPVLDMSENRRHVEPVFENVETLNEIQSEFELKEFNYDDIDRMSMRSNVSFFCIINFKTTTLNGEEMIAMSGQEMDGSADDYVFRKTLDDGLNIT
jgi:hypothetical protein